nr:hypothetical protein [Tanacetum cinerariifolium]
MNNDDKGVLNIDEKYMAKKHIVSNKLELNDHMYNWIIANSSELKFLGSDELDLYLSSSDDLDESDSSSSSSLEKIVSMDVQGSSKDLQKWYEDEDEKDDEEEDEKDEEDNEIDDEEEELWTPKSKEKEQDIEQVRKDKRKLGNAMMNAKSISTFASATFADVS